MIDELTFLRARVLYNLQNVMKRNKQLYRSDAYHQCCRGREMSREEFYNVVDSIADLGWLKISHGQLGGVLLTYVDTNSLV